VHFAVPLAPVAGLAPAVLVTATALWLWPSATTTLAARLATTPTNFRPRRALLMWRSLLTRRHLRPRDRLTTAATTTTIELASRRLRRAGPLSRRHVVHFPRLRS
jgi:hypothetical protein